MSENRRAKRLLLRKGDRKDLGTTYLDNVGNEYDYKWIAQMSSAYNLLKGCFKNGFPVTSKRLRYNGWAFYPFIVLNSKIPAASALPIILHERIHIRQQRELLMLFGIPLVILSGILELFGSFNPFLLICVCLIPTIAYTLNMLWVWGKQFHFKIVPMQTIRVNTAFERESQAHCMNEQYLVTRKPFAFLKYL